MNEAYQDWHPVEMDRQADVEQNAMLYDETGNNSGCFRKTMGKFARSGEFAALVLEAYHRHADSRRSTIVFAADNQCVDLFTTVFLAAGIETHALSGDTPRMKRESILRGFKAGKFPVLINCLVLAEGADVPSVSSMALDGQRIRANRTGGLRNPGTTNEKPHPIHSDGEGALRGTMMRLIPGRAWNAPIAGNRQARLSGDRSVWDERYAWAGCRTVIDLALYSNALGRQDGEAGAGRSEAGPRK